MGPPASAVRPTEDDRVVQAYIHDRFIELFLSQSKRAQAGQVVSALLVAFIWMQPDTAWWAAGWLLLVLLVTAWRAVKTETFVRNGPGPSATARVGAVLGVNGVLMALPLVGFAHMSEIERAALSIILIALATGSVGTTAGYRQVFLAYGAPMLVPLGLAWALTTHPNESPATAAGLGLLIVIFLAFLASVAQQQYRVFEDACRIRFAETRLNAQLQQALDNESEAHRAKTQFLAAASHDLRQPIHSMNVLVAALSMRELDERSSQIARLLGTVNQTLAAQLDALLDISRLDAGTVQPAFSRQQLERLLAEHGDLVQPAAASKGLRCQLTLEGSLPVWTDPSLLLRIVSNLTDNAMKYNRSGGQILVRAWREGDSACLSVADTGIGIDATEQAKVFREFYQVDNVERDRTKGLGLGLSIVQRLAQLLQIQVSLHSVAGEGTTVTLRLPLLQDGTAATARDAVVAASADHPTAPVGLAGLRVLVVDDDPQVRQSMELLLTEVGCRVHLATGTAQACEVARQTPLDAMLTDLRLQAGDDGLQVLRAVQALQPGLRCALITGDTGPDRLQQAQSAGVPLLHKPVTLDTLRRVLEPAQPR